MEKEFKELSEINQVKAQIKSIDNRIIKRTLIVINLFEYKKILINKYSVLLHKILNNRRRL